MAAGYKDFTAGSTLAAADLEDYCELQTVMRFADASARNTALSGVLTEGLLAFLLDTNSLTVYSGSAWSTVGPVHGAWTTYAPTLTQSGSVTHTATYAKYMRVGRTIIGQVYLSVTGTGTASNVVTVSLPVTAGAPTSGVVIGAGSITDSSASAYYNGAAFLASSTTVAIFHGAGGVASGLGVNGFSAALASGDVVTVSFTYEASADA